MNQNELYHFGVKGMKWGVRRTPAQLGHDRKSKNSRLSDDYKESKAISKKKVKEMSNAELRKLNERKRLENEYKKLNKGTVAKGLAYVTAAAATTNTLVNLYNNSERVINIGKKAGDKMLNIAGDVILKDFRKGW